MGIGILAVVLMLVGGLTCFQRLSNGVIVGPNLKDRAWPPLWLALRRFNITSLLIDEKSTHTHIEITDPQQLDRFYQVVIAEYDASPYAVADEYITTLTFQRRFQGAFILYIGGYETTVYLPQYERTYYSSLLHNMVQQVMHNGSLH